MSKELGDNWQVLIDLGVIKVKEMCPPIINM